MQNADLKSQIEALTAKVAELEAAGGEETAE